MKSQERQLVIGDIHGCSKTLKELINKIGLSKTDKLIFVGDYIDRGVDSGGVIDFILDLKSNGYSIVTLRGNHEENLIYAYHHYNPKMFRKFVGSINKSWNLLNDDGILKAKYLGFVNSLPYYYDLGDYLIVHAGLNFKNEDPLADKVAMLEIRRFAKNADITRIGNRRIIHGHQPTILPEIEEAIRERLDVIPLDNGCVYTKPHRVLDYRQLGHLCCLDIRNDTLITQKNVDS